MGLINLIVWIYLHLNIINLLVLQIVYKKMADLIKIKGLKGKQNKKKWRKNIDVSGLLQHMQQQHTQKIRQKFVSALVVEAQTDGLRKPLDPKRFKSKGVPLPKTKYSNKIKKQSILQEPMEDAWQENKQVRCKYKRPSVPAVIKPSTGHSYNPSEEGIKRVIETVIDYEAPKQKKTKKIKKLAFKQQEVRHRNKNVRAQQLEIRERKAAKQTLHEIYSHKKINKQLQKKVAETKSKVQHRELKKTKLQEQARSGKVRYGKRIGKLQYKFREQLPNPDEIGKKLSHVGGNQALIKDRFDSIYRRGIFQPRNIKVHANRTKRIKTKTKYREEQLKKGINFIQ